MIQASKATVVTSFHRDTIEVRRLELDYYLMVFDKLSTISTVLAGFASSALMVGIPRRDNPYLVTLFLLSTGSALGAHLLVVIVSTMCIMWGPGHALRGEDASYVDNALYHLDVTAKAVEKFFLFGLVCYFASSVLVVWLLFDPAGSLVVSVIFVVVLTWLYCKSLRIYRALTPNKVVSGRVANNRVQNLGHLMGDATGTLEQANVSTQWATHI